MAKTPVAILISGRGSNMDAIIQACLNGDCDADVKVVISNNPNAKGIDIAKSYGITTFVLEIAEFASKLEYEEDIVRVLKGHNIEVVCLAGYMRVIDQTLLDAFPNRIINIHPSLLPAFKGLNAQKQALEYGVKVAGCSVHYVNCKIDGGKIIDQETVPVHADDTVESLSQRILEKEHIIYPRALQTVISILTRTKENVL